MIGGASEMAWPSDRTIRGLAASPGFLGAIGSLDEEFAEFLRMTREVAEIPAPSFRERARADWVSAHFRAAGLVAETDDSASVVAMLPGQVPGVLVAAHTDTVFAADEDHHSRLADGRLQGRGVGDNSIGVAALVRLPMVVARLRCPRAVWFAATSREEGLGNLGGIRSVTDRLNGRIGVCVALEGHFLGDVVITAVGSWRARFVLRGPGGHSWHDYGGPSAIHGAGALIAALTRMRLPRRPRTTLNIGRVAGGQGVNVIASEASIEIDLRSQQQAALASWATRVVETAGAIAESHRLTLEVVPLGERPAGTLARRHPAVRAAQVALALTHGPAKLAAASTDANYPASRGIPSVCIGVTRGRGMHTAEEWVEAETARHGLHQIALLTAALAGARA